MKKRVAITLHGIRTRGKWQKDLAPILAMHDVVPYPLDFGRFGALSLLLPYRRDAKLNWFHSEYQRVQRETGITRPSIIAHSFGSYLTCRLLHIFREFVHFDKIILAGSIVQNNFDWSEIIANEQAVQVRNEVATRDIWPRVAKTLVSDAGDSGTKGFAGLSGNGRRCEHTHEIGHSGTHFEAMYHDWAKFISCTQYLAGADMRVISQLLELAAGRTADNLQVPRNSIRANILLPTADDVLKIPEGAHYNMLHASELDINIPIGRGLSGVAFKERKELAYLEEASHHWGQYALPRAELAKVDPALAWVLSFPLADPGNGRVFGVMSVDGLAPSAIVTSPFDSKTEAAILELKTRHVPAMAHKLCNLETGGF